MAYEYLLVEARGKVGLVQINRPKQLNALNDALMNELCDALASFDSVSACTPDGNGTSTSGVSPSFLPFR